MFQICLKHYYNNVRPWPLRSIYISFVTNSRHNKESESTKDFTIPLLLIYKYSKYIECLNINTDKVSVWEKISFMGGNWKYPDNLFNGKLSTYTVEHQSTKCNLGVYFTLKLFVYWRPLNRYLGKLWTPRWNTAECCTSTVYSVC